MGGRESVWVGVTSERSTQSLPATLAGPWPVCRFRSFNPYTVTDAELTVNGLPCVLGYTPRDVNASG